MSQAALAEIFAPAPETAAPSNESLLARFMTTRAPTELERLVRQNQRLVHHVLKRFSDCGEPYEDLVQVGNIGLIKAARNFDADNGARFSTYALTMIEGEIRHHLRDSTLLRQPRWMRSLGAQMAKAAAELTERLGREPETAELAEALNVSEEGIREVQAYRSKVELCAAEDGDDEGCPPSLDRHAVRSRRYESFSLPIEDRIALSQAMERLTEKERDLVDLLCYREFTQREVAEALGVTRKKVSRDFNRALGRLREVLNKPVF